MKTITFCTSRTAAREFAKSVDGKVQDMGAESAQGARWGVVHEVPDDVQVQERAPKSKAIKEMAARLGLDCQDVDIRPEQIDPQLLRGLPIPVLVEDQTVDTKNIASRPILKAPSKPKGVKHNSGVLVNAKRKHVEVQFKRSTTSVATTAALFAMRLK